MMEQRISDETLIALISEDLNIEEYGEYVLDDLYESRQALAESIAREAGLREAGNRMAAAIEAMNEADCRQDVSGGLLQRIKTLGEALEAMNEWRKL